MTLNKSLHCIMLFSFVMLSAALNAQSIDKNCDEIKIETKIFNPEPGKSNGKIQIVFKEESKTYKIFLLNAGSERSKKEIENGIIDNLRVGFYDILIIDKDGCNRQLTITLK